jgi:hypothetical protein
LPAEGDPKSLLVQVISPSAMGSHPTQTALEAFDFVFQVGLTIFYTPSQRSPFDF